VKDLVRKRLLGFGAVQVDVRSGVAAGGATSKETRRIMTKYGFVLPGEK
jgi:hypothetical protein